jgi:hypothetical protein
MRSWLAALVLSWLPLAPALACKSRPERSESPVAPAESPQASALSRSASLAALASSEVVAFEKTLQASKLSPPPCREHEPRLAFGKTMFAQLTRDALCVFDANDFRLLATEPLEAPRAVLALADGALLAVGANTMLRWEPDQKRPKALPRLVLLPGAELYADAQQADLLWVFAAGDRRVAGLPATLSSFRLAPGDGPLLLPEQTIALTSPPGGAFGTSREGVWLYFTPGRGERFGPSGLRLSGLTFAEISPPTWVLPARRLDQALWLDEAGQVSRVLVSPTFKHLAKATLAGRAFAADVGDQGRLLAVVVVTGEGPRFELELFDPELQRLARVALPGDAPTGTEAWVKVVTENQAVVVAERKARVAVGGPGRVLIFDAQGRQLFSIPSR